MRGPQLRRRLGAFDLTFITVGTIVGSGIFRSPSVVAARVHEPLLIVAAWVLGGLIALCGVWIAAELAARRPSQGGFYAYLRDAFHPLVAFVFGWLYLFGIDTGAVAASGLTFATYFESLSGLSVAPRVLAGCAIAFFTLVNFLGVRQGGTAQNVLTVAKTLGVILVIAIGATARPVTGSALPFAPFPAGTSALAAFGIAMVPVFFAYNGFLSTTYIIGETKEPQRNVPRGLIAGIAIVIPLYVAINAVCVHVLGPRVLASTATPAADVVSAAAGSLGSRLIAVVVTLSTLGFIGTKLLLTPRMYHRMAVDGLFFEPVARIDRRTRVPIPAVALQGAIAIVIASSGSFDAIINYIVALDYVFVALAAVALVVFRRRDAGTPQGERVYFKTPGHPYTTALFFIAVTAVVIDTFVAYPRNSAVCAAVTLAGTLAYFVWRRVPALGR